MIEPQQFDDDNEALKPQFSDVNFPKEDEEKSNIIGKILETDGILSQIQNFLLGYYKDENGDLKHDKSLQLINEKGCRSILFEIGTRISSQVTLGNLEEQEAKMRAEKFESALALKLVNNFQQWELQNITAMDIIVDAAGDLVFSSLTRPIGGEAFKGIIQMLQIRQHTLQRDIVSEPKKEGFLKNMFKNTKGGF